MKIKHTALSALLALTGSLTLAVSAAVAAPAAQASRAPSSCTMRLGNGTVHVYAEYHPGGGSTHIDTNVPIALIVNAVTGPLRSGIRYRGWTGIVHHTSGFAFFGPTDDDSHYSVTAVNQTNGVYRTCAG